MKILSENLHCGQIHIDRIRFLWFRNVSNALIDLKMDLSTAIYNWYAVINYIVHTWDPRRTCWDIYDLPHTRLTPYFRNRSIDITITASHLQGCYAIINPSADPHAGVMRQHLDINIRGASAHEGRNLHNITTAHQWLEVLS